ncbi:MULTISPECIES: pyridoxal phosphate-dependent aminotransferase [Hyphomonas]|uniref:Histidinol phosphate aminotransferase n=1 Tax=Hyphomonas adhaerens TaxID=81029 RepID=A0A3B9H0B1_9PROT|nr:MULTISPECIES: histidinol-phosphate transaminase [Hyphomonas]MBB39389.1 histidinol phosphate aminotransferase [Hyphomonas sp.]HAE28135.1 histidinol phosphate aminotransferase [Hyphomonas adhaerens]|tara:strand:- start:1078 stop:2241 length:1164 start_codon:yes stop_codon:yes gene_type:complete
MTRFSSEPLFSPSRRSLMKLAGAGAVGAATALSACSETATAATPANDAVDPDAIAILSSNENPYGPSPMAVEAIKAEAGNLYRYTYPTVMKFAEMIAAKEGVAPEQVLVTNGSTPILAAFSDWVNVNGGKIVTSAITYEGVPRVAEQAGTEVVYMPLTQDMGYDMEAIAARVGPDTGAVYLCNPNNPTGKTIPTEQLKAFVEDVSNKVPVFVDEAYLDMSDDYPGNVMSEFVAAGKPVIVARTFSKIYGMAGQRLGYGLMPADMAMDMRKTGRLSNVNYLGLVGGIASVKDTAHFEKMRATMIRGRQKLVAMAADLGRPIAPDPQGSFIYMDVGMPAKDFASKMMDRGVRVVGERWSDLPNWTRICVGLDHEIDKCHAAAKEVLTSI